MTSRLDGTEVAVVGLACRFPGAAGPERFWQNLLDGAEAVRPLTAAELDAAGVTAEERSAPGFVAAGAPLDGPELFDAGFFGYSHREAEILDPQQRLFLECCWEGLEDAGCEPAAAAASGLRIGVFGGATTSSYLLFNLAHNPAATGGADPLQLLVANAADSLTTRVAYKLGLEGPAFAVQCACSTSLVAVHLACQSLLAEECDLAIAGGVSVPVSQSSGYRYRPGSILSPDGHCRPFDAAAAGTVFGSGAGVVVLRRAEDALADGDPVRALVRGSAVNNDGSYKVGYTAPSVEGQAKVISEALAVAGVAPESLGYVEAHGTGTALGDPIEIQALTRAFRASTGRTGFCPIGSVKASVGHLDVAAGVAGLIKTILSLEREAIPASLNYRRPNPKIDLASSPVYVAAETIPWPRGPEPRRAGVSSFGFGGTNAHVVLEEAPPAPPFVDAPGPHLLVLSARSEPALGEAARRLAAHLEARPELPLAGVARTLRAGRRAFDHRLAVVASDAGEVARLLVASATRPGGVYGAAPEASGPAAAGARWVAGGELDPEPSGNGPLPPKVPLPTYPFERQRYWIDPPGIEPPGRAAAAPAGAHRAEPAAEVHPRPDLPTPYVEPRGEMERRVAAVWGRVLGVDRVGRQDNFFDLGGDSLIAVAAIDRLTGELGRELPVVSLYEGLTVATLAELIERETGEGGPPEGEAAADALDELEAARERRRAFQERRRRGPTGGTPPAVPTAGLLFWLLAGLLLAALAGSSAAPLRAQEPPELDREPVVPASGLPERPGEYLLQASLMALAPELDGVMDEAAWEDAVLIDRFTQLETKEGEPVTEPTEIRIGYDHANLYVGARCYDSEPERIRGTVMTRDGSLAYEDAVMIVLDTFHDRKSGFLFMVNPVGAQYDATVRQEGEEVNEDWDGLWRVAATRDERGWTAEIAIPFRTLRFPDRDVQTWGINVGRFIARKREEAYWKPMERSYGFWARYKVSRFGQITGFEGLERGGRYQVEPYLVTGLRRRPGGSDELVTEPGLDLKTHLTSDLVADLTLNTDFAETEADQQQINLTRFKLFFPEKREFFLEGADLFYFGERPEPYNDPEMIFFFSRRIGLTEDGDREIPILGGAKITGRVGETGVGVLTAATDEEVYLDRTGARLTEPQTTYSVVRLEHEIGDGGSTLGFLGMDKDPAGELGRDNRGYGLDWDAVRGENLKLGGYVARTETPGLDGDDWAAYQDLWWDSRRARVRLAYSEIGEDFNPEMGFITRTGVRKVRSNLTRVFWPESERVRQWFAVHYLDYVTDRDGSIESRLNNVEVSVLYANSSGLAFKAYDQREVLRQPFEIHPGVVIQPGQYDFRYGFFGFQTDYSKPVGGAGRLQFGELYDGDLTRLFGAVVLRPRPGVLGVLLAERTEVDLSAGSFTTDLVTADAQVSLSPRFTTISKLQWNREDNLRVRLILDWRWRPGSSLYLVYDETEDLVDPLDRHARPVPLDERAFLVKVTYQFDR